MTRRPFPEFNPDDTEPPGCVVCDYPYPLRFAEMVPAVRSIIVTNGKVWIDNDEELICEGAEDEHAYCRGCLAEYDLPEGYDYL